MDRTHELMTAIADRFEAQLDEMVEEADRLVFDATPALGADPAIASEVSASNRANFHRFATVARYAGDRPPADVPPEALDVARTLVRRGIQSDAIYAGYRRGQQIGWQCWMACAEAVVEAREELVAVLDLSVRLVFEYLDAVLGSVIAAMDREREEVLGGALARRTETLRLILDGAPLDAQTAGRRLRYDLARHHTAAILWAEGAAQGALESAAEALALAAGARRPLSMPAGTTTLWAWIGSDAGLPSGDLRAALAGTDVR